MNNIPLDKIRTLAVTKVTSLFILVVLAVALFSFPLVAFGFSGTGSTGWGPSQNVTLSSQQETITVKLYAAYKIQSDGVSPGNTGKFWPDAKTSYHNKSPIGVTITTNVKASDIPAGAIVQVDAPHKTPQPKSDNGNVLTPHNNALCIGKNLVLLVLDGKLQRATLVDGNNTNSSKR